VDQWCIFRPMWEGVPETEAVPAGRSVEA